MRADVDCRRSSCSTERSSLPSTHDGLSGRPRRVRAGRRGERARCRAMVRAAVLQRDRGGDLAASGGALCGGATCTGGAITLSDRRVQQTTIHGKSLKRTRRGCSPAGSGAARSS